MAAPNRSNVGVLMVLWTAAAGMSCTARVERGALAVDSMPQVDSTMLNNTVVTCHLEEPIAADKNLVYCAAFQLAWNELRDNLVGEDVRLSGDPLAANVLNRELVHKKDLSEDSYVALAGLGRDGILDKINSALSEKFGSAAPSVAEDLGPNDILAYAFMLKGLVFETSFEDLADSLSFRHDDQWTPVKAFGIEQFHGRSRKQQDIAAQVSVLAYDDARQEYVVRLATESETDELLLARMEPAKTMIETIGKVSALIDAGAEESLLVGDTLQIPKVDFNIRHSYPEFLGKALLNKGYEGYVCTKAMQDIRFRLDERGVHLASEARVVFRGGNHRLTFSGPFLVLLRQKGCDLPYLAIWVANTELLQKR